jgi:peptidoglycan/xylan/chitin deacetylase (PgdA/CDA1 family)
MRDNVSKGAWWSKGVVAAAGFVLLAVGCMAVGAAPRATALPAAAPSGVAFPTPTTRDQIVALPEETVTGSAVTTPTLALRPTPTQTPTMSRRLPARLPTTTPRPLLPTPSPAPAPAVAAPVVLAPTPDGVTRTVRVPILMYHYLSTPPADADIYRQDLSVPPELFAAHLERMLADGYTAISLYDLQAHLMQGAPLPDKPVVITFDDGYRDNYDNAFPLLRARGMTATFFVVTDFIDEERPAYLTWDMAREMHAGGMSIESHGRNHASLQGRDADFLVWQALGSLETIEYELGVRPRFVSYPAGEFDQRTIDIFASANYWAGATTVQGATHSSADPFRLTRVRVRNTTTPDELSRLLALAW